MKKEVVKLVRTKPRQTHGNTDIPECPYCMSSLVIVNGLLTTVGGRTGESAHSFSSFHPPFNYINKLYSLDVGRWNDNLPPMPTARSNPAVATCGHYLVVAGGSCDGKPISSVELLKTSTLQWYRTSNLPHPLTRASITEVNNKLYVLGAPGCGNTVYSADFSELEEKAFHSYIRTPFFHSEEATDTEQETTVCCWQLRTSSRHQMEDKDDDQYTISCWKKIDDAPLSCSTCISFNNQLIAVGGCDPIATSASDIYHYQGGRWKLIGNVPTPRYNCFVVVLSDNTIIVVGGTRNYKLCDNVELATPNY